jgi:hypothetical protein
LRENSKEWVYHVEVGHDPILIKLHEKRSLKETALLTGFANRLKPPQQSRNPQNLINPNNKPGQITPKGQRQHPVKIGLKETGLKLCQIGYKEYWEADHPRG